MNRTRRHHLKLTAALLAAPMAACSSQSSESGDNPEATTLVPMRTVAWQDWLGVNTQLHWFAPEVARVQVDRLKALGLNWVRHGLHWMLLEPEAGAIDVAGIDQAMALSQSAGLNSMAYLVGTPRFLSSVEPDSPYLQYFDKFPPHAPQSYAQRLVWLAQRYPQVNVWQVWNEPNILGFWAPKPDPEGYARLLQTSVQALRAALPSKPIAMAGMAYFSEMAGGGLMLEALGRMGAFNHNLVVAYHPYTPDAEGSSRNAPDFVSRARHMNQSLRKANVGQVWATEWGWSSYAGPQEEQPIVGEDGQADLTLRRLALMAALDFDRVFLFTLSDLDRRASVRDRSYGLLRENGEPKPVYHALSRMLTVCGPRLTPAAEQTLGSQQPTGLVSIRWKRVDGRYVWMVWAAAPGAVNLPGVIQAEVHQPLQGTSMVVRAPDGVDAAQGVRVNITTVLQLVVYG